MQYPNGAFSVLEKNWDFKPQVKKWWQGSTVLNLPKSYKNMDFGGLGKVRISRLCMQTYWDSSGSTAYILVLV